MTSITKIITDNSNLITQIEEWKQNKQKIVFTNGCFDILHVGHISYLEEAKTLGDKLIVAVNTDNSVKRLKGESRPINALYARMRLLAALACVDAVVAFDEDTPLLVIQTILPDVLVKGGDYEITKIVGYETVTQHGGQVLTLPFIEGYSTTQTIEKMKE